MSRSGVRSRRHRGGHREQGFVTAELAAALPAVVAILAAALWAVAVVGVKMRAVDAAHSAAIAAARGEDAQAAAAPYLPDGASVTVVHEGTLVRATVSAPAKPFGPLAPGMSIGASAAAPVEPGVRG
jgi:type IV secretory pathway TrbD component